MCCVVSALLTYAWLPSVCRMTARLSMRSPVCMSSNAMTGVFGFTTNQPPNGSEKKGQLSASTPAPPAATLARNASRCSAVTWSSRSGCTAHMCRSVAHESGKSSANILEHQSSGTLFLRTHVRQCRGHLVALVPSSQQ